jgi:hypothetical protein
VFISGPTDGSRLLEIVHNRTNASHRRRRFDRASRLLLCEGGDELAAKVGDARDEAAPDDVDKGLGHPESLPEGAL